ncbi:EspG family protein [Amycolatopsis xylanica]|uniref:EspG family protein n=1 Tax=Amycolatopsis xylanica TaxID=589385 RepID=A0A1H3AL81_9PSEU|nr:ESX secretion-associated protein EspG [Amycolatopsis xylanica]SDX30365.1 EspG family protein [Amycolatopsis xylanica]
MLANQVTVATATLINLIRRRDGEPHTVLAETPTFYDQSAQRKEDDRVNAELARYGLFGPRGLDSGLKATLEAVARPQLEYYAWIDGGYEGKALKYTLLAGSAGGEGFVLARNPEHEGVVLASVKPSEVLESFIEQIPKLAPGRGHPLVVPKSQVAGVSAATTAQDDGYSVLRSGQASAGSQEAGELRRILGLRRMGGGSLYVAARGRTGNRQRIERPVNYIDTSEGRWLTEEVPGSGEPAIAFTPANQQLLAERLQSAQGRLFAS